MTIRRAFLSFPIAFLALILAVPAPAAATQSAYIVNYGSNTLSVIDTASRELTITTPTDAASPVGVAVSPTGHIVYFTNNAGNYVTVIDLIGRSHYRITVGSAPLGIAIDQSGSRLYVSNYTSKSVSIINTGDNSVETIPVGSSLNGIAVNPAGTRVYIAYSSAGVGRVSVIDTSSKTVIDTVTVGLNPWGLAVSPDGKRVYVTNTNGGSVSVINTEVTPNIVADTVTVGTSPRGIAFNPAGTRAYVANYGSGNVSVIDTTTTPNSVITNVTVETGPYGVAVTPDGAHVYVSNNGSGSVSVIDTTNNSVVTTILVDTNPTSLGNFIGPEYITCPDKKVRINDVATYYSTIGAAYANSVTGDTIRAEVVEFAENPEFASNVDITLKGGYECFFTDNPGWTTVSGYITLKGGTVTMDRIKIR